MEGSYAAVIAVDERRADLTREAPLTTGARTTKKAWATRIAIRPGRSRRHIVTLLSHGFAARFRHPKNFARSLRLPFAQPARDPELDPDPRCYYRNHYVRKYKYRLIFIKIFLKKSLDVQAENSGQFTLLPQAHTTLAVNTSTVWFSYNISKQSLYFTDRE